jgi:low affinity Fe/Cu permease
MFDLVARRVSQWTGSAQAFAWAAAAILLWACTGPLFGYSDTWQLIINTSTTIVTFLMVFVLQNTQARDTLALQVKLDALIEFSRADNRAIGLEDADTETIAAFKRWLAERKQQHSSQIADR